MSPSPKVLPSVIWQAYERIISHPSFQHSETLSKILQCLLAAEELDEHVDGRKLALRVYGDNAESRQQALRSSVVRLRRQLQLYYAGPGANDPIIIEMEERAYRAVASVRRKMFKSGFSGVLGDGVAKVIYVVDVLEIDLDALYVWRG